MEILFTRQIYTVKLTRVLKPYNKYHNAGSRAGSTVPLVYKTYGELAKGAPPIIILHGLLGSKKNWDSMAKKIKSSTGKAIVCVDARNHGESPHANSHLYTDQAADVYRVMRKLKIKEATVMGHSMGGRTAMTLALTKPTIVSNLIVVDVSPVSSPGKLNDFFPRLWEVMKSVKFEAKTLATARQEAMHKLKQSGVVEDFATLNFLLMNVIERKKDQFGWMCNIIVLQKHFEYIASFPLELAGKFYQGPTLFIAGEESNYVPLSDTKGIREFFPQAEIQFVKKAGHNVHYDAPDIFLSLVTNFIREYSLK